MEEVVHTHRPNRTHTRRGVIRQHYYGRGSGGFTAVNTVDTVLVLFRVDPF